MGTPVKSSVIVKQEAGLSGKSVTVHQGKPLGSRPPLPQDNSRSVPQPAQQTAQKVDFAAVASGQFVPIGMNNSHNQDAAGSSGQGAGYPSASGVSASVSNDKSGSKRPEGGAQIVDARPSKQQCSGNFKSILEGVQKNMEEVLNMERDKLLYEKSLAEAAHKENIRKIRAETTEEIRRIKEEHAKALDAQAVSFTQELNLRKSAEQEERAKQLAEKEKEFKCQLDALNGKLNLSSTAFKTSIAALRNEMENQESKRIQSLTLQHEAEKKAALAEARLESQTTEASLRATLAERDVQLANFKKVVDSIENIRGMSETLATMPDQVAKIQYLNSSFISSIEGFQREMQHLQGFLSAFQASAANSRTFSMAPVYWHPAPGPGPMHGGAPHRGGANAGFLQQQGP